MGIKIVQLLRKLWYSMLYLIANVIFSHYVSRQVDLHTNECFYCSQIGFFSWVFYTFYTSGIFLPGFLHTFGQTVYWMRTEVVRSNLGQNWPKPSWFSLQLQLCLFFTVFSDISYIFHSLFTFLQFYLSFCFYNNNAIQIIFQADHKI